jgi:hypothetical protein
VNNKIKKLSRFVLIFIFLFSIFNHINVNASEDIFTITKIEVKEKSDGVFVKLVGGAGTVYNSSIYDASYARIDNPSLGQPGYFTLKNY